MPCCSVDGQFPCKPQLEDVVLEFDYSPSMQNTETILQVVSCTVTVLAGEDPAPGNVLDGTPVIEGQSVLVPMHNGIKGVTYFFSVLVNTSLRDNLVLQGYITVL